MSRTLADAFALALARLAALPSPRSDAEELLSRLFGTTRTQLQLDRARLLGDGDWGRLEAWISRRAAGEPVQYITGRAAFRGLDLVVTPAVLVPRPETEGLVEAVLEALRAETARWPKPRVLDLGTGSGAIALALAAEWPAAEVVGTDASEEALAVAWVNAVEHQLAGRVRLVRGDWFDAVAPDERFEVVASNPPYIAEAEWEGLPAEVRDHEPREALVGGDGGLDELRTIVDEAPRHLVAGGLLALELAEMRAEEVAAWLEGAHDWERVELRDDLAGRPRMLLARRTIGPAIAPLQWPEDR
jgi:release factor glutamine methyltransferase